MTSVPPMPITANPRGVGRPKGRRARARYIRSLHPSLIGPMDDYLAKLRHSLESAGLDKITA